MGTDVSKSFCIEHAQDCATWVTNQFDQRPSLGLQPEDVVIAVKTVEKFHETRIPLVHMFWGKASKAEVLYLSNAAYKGFELRRTGAPFVDLSVEFGSMVDPAKESTS